MSEPQQAAQRQRDERRPGRSRRTYTVRLDPALCKSCGICSKLCPKQVFDAGVGSVPPSVARPADCNGCRFCELHCPDAAIEVLPARTGEAAPSEVAVNRVRVAAGPENDDAGDE